MTNIDGTDGSIGSLSTNGFSAQILRIFRGNVGTPPTLNGSIAEVGMKSGGGSSERTAIFNNQNGTNGYNGAL